MLLSILVYVHVLLRVNCGLSSWFGVVCRGYFVCFVFGLLHFEYFTLRVCPPFVSLFSSREVGHHCVLGKIWYLIVSIDGVSDLGSISFG